MKKWALCICAGLVLLSGKAFAEQPQNSDAVEELRRTVEQQRQAINDLVQRLEALEAKQKGQGDTIEAVKKEEEKPVWTDKISLGGDFRYRYDWIGKEDTHVRTRNRIRLRLNAKAKIADDLDVAAQIATGETKFANEGDPLSNNQTLTDAFSPKNIWITQAYLDWHPDYLIPGIKLLAGKMPRPFYIPGAGTSELIWDPDLDPEGAAIKYSKSFGSLEPFAGLYGFWTMERNSSADFEDSGLVGAQAGLKYKFAFLDDDAYVLGGLSDYNYLNTGGKAPFPTGAISFGNTLNPDGTFANDFNEVEPFGEFGFKLKGIPVIVFADYVNNTQADDENNGWLVGFVVGKLTEPRTWQFKYFYRRLEKDAVFGEFTDDDFAGGGTDVEGNQLYLAYQLSKNVTLETYLYLANKIGIAPGEDEIDYNRVFLQALVKF